MTQEPSPEPSALSGPNARRSLRIIIADDDRDTVLSLTALLRDEGHQTKGVYHGEEVVKAVVDFGADAVLLDIGMPGKSGYTVAQELRMRYGDVAPLMIAVTAWDKAVDKLMAQLAGFDHHVAKPYDPNYLITLITPLTMGSWLRGANTPTSSGARGERRAQPRNRAKPLVRGNRVLIVDDERDTLMTLGILLRTEGYEVRLETGGAQVPAAVADFRPDLILLDIGMPDRSGYDLAQELCERYGEACPVLMAVTAYTSASDKQMAEASGFHHHVAKPYDPRALLALIASMRNPS